MKIEVGEIKMANYLIPITGAYFILYGAVKLISYYSIFNLPILDYIQFSEIISSFIKDIFKIFTLLIVFLLFFSIAKFLFQHNSRIFALKMRNINDKLDEIQASVNDDKLKGSFSNLFRTLRNSDTISLQLQNIGNRMKMWRLFIYTVCTIGILFCFFKLGIIYSIIFIMPFCFLAMSFYWTRNILFALSICVVMFLLSSAYVDAHEDYRDVIRGKNFGHEFIVNEKTIRSDSVNFFIGKTEVYLFYYKSLEKKTIVFKTENIESISIPDN